MAPESPGVERVQRVRHQPRLRRDRVQPLPLVRAQDAEVELAPARNVLGAAPRRDPRQSGARGGVRLGVGLAREVFRAPSLLAFFAAGDAGSARAEKTQSDVAEHRAEHRGVALDVQAVAAVLVLVVAEVPAHLRARRGGEDVVELFHHVQRDHEAREQEHRPAVIARPVPVLVLQALEEVHARAQALVHPRRAARGRRATAGLVRRGRGGVWRTLPRASRRASYCRRRSASEECCCSCLCFANSARARSTAARSAFVPASGSHVHVFRPTCPFREKRSRTIGLAVTSPAEAHRSFHIGTRSAASERDGGAAETTSARRRVRPQRGRVCEAGEAGWGAKSES